MKKDDRRKTKRFSSMLPLFYFHLVDQQESEGKKKTRTDHRRQVGIVINASQTGLSFLTFNHLDSGDVLKLNIRFFLKGQSRNCPFLGRSAGQEQNGKMNIRKKTLKTLTFAVALN